MSELIKTELGLPTISNIKLIEDLSKFKTLLSKQPDIKKVKEHPFISVKINGQTVKYKYIPIEEIQNNLDSLFLGLYTIEVRDVKTFVNSVMVTLRINYFHPVFKMWLFVDGVGASSLQVNKDKNPTDLSELKQDSVVMALPKAKTEALKNAAKELGNKFGRSLNKDVQSEFIMIDTINSMLTGMTIDEINNEKERLRVLTFINNANDIETLEQVKDASEIVGVLEQYYSKKESLKNAK